MDLSVLVSISLWSQGVDDMQFGIGVFHVLYKHIEVVTIS